MTEHLIRLFTTRMSLSVGEINGIRERKASEMIHYRKEMNEPCHLCDAENSTTRLVWVDSIDRWRKHPFHCDAVAHILRNTK